MTETVQKTKRSNPKVKRRAFVDDYHLYESIICGEETCFLMYDGRIFQTAFRIIPLDTPIKEEPKEQTEPKTVAQMKSEALPFFLARRPLDFDLEEKKREWQKWLDAPNKQDVFNRLLAVLDKYVDLLPEYKNLCAIAIMLSYEQHKFNWLPIIGIFGDTGSGKSVLGELLAFLCYRCGYFELMNSANFYTFLDEFDSCFPTLAEDEIQGFETDTDKVKIYKTGCSKTGKVPRVQFNPYGKRGQQYMPTFCLKIMIGEEMPNVKGLRERTIYIPMSKGKPNKSWYGRTESDVEELKRLKFELLKLRMMNYKSVYENGFSTRTRIEDDLYPLRCIAQDLSIKNDFEAWCNAQLDVYQKEKVATKEGILVMTLFALMNFSVFHLEQITNRTFVSFDAIWTKFKDLCNGVDIPYHPEKITTVEFGEISKNKLGKMLTDIFNSKSESRRVQDSVVKVRVFDIDTLLRVFGNYLAEKEIEKTKLKIAEKVTALRESDTQ